MKKYSVYMRREECQYLEVEAHSPEQAERIALENAGAVVWDETPRFEVLATEEERDGDEEEGDEETRGS